MVEQTEALDGNRKGEGARGESGVLVGASDRDRMARRGVPVGTVDG